MCIYFCSDSVHSRLKAKETFQRGYYNDMTSSHQWHKITHTHTGGSVSLNLRHSINHLSLRLYHHSLTLQIHGSNRHTHVSAPVNTKHVFDKQLCRCAVCIYSSTPSIQQEHYFNKEKSSKMKKIVMKNFTQGHGGLSCKRT